MFGGGNAKKLKEVTEKLQAKERADQESAGTLRVKDAEIQEMRARIAQMEQAMKVTQEEASHAKKEAADWRQFGESQRKTLEALEEGMVDLERKHKKDKETLQGMNDAVLSAEKAQFELKGMESLREEAVAAEKRAAAALERSQVELKELCEAGLRTQRELDQMRGAQAEALAKMEAAEKVVAYAKKEAFDFQRFGERTQRELDTTRAAKEVMEKKLAEIGPKLAQTALELGVARREANVLRESARERDEHLSPIAMENGTLREDLEKLRESEAQIRAEFSELQNSSEHERLYLSQEASSWKEFAKRNQLEMEMYVGKKVNEIADALRSAQDMSPQLTASLPGQIVALKDA